MTKKFNAGKRIAKVNNHRAAKLAKIEIRRNVLQAIGSHDAVVFDAFAGSGEMFRNVWREAKSYVGCDLEWHRDGRLAYVADNRRVMRAIDLAAFTIFDLDSHGAPWEQALILAARRKIAPGERIGIVLTDGSGLSLKRANIPCALAEISGLSGHLAGLARWQDDVITRAIAGLAARLCCRVERRWQANGGTGAIMVYVGLVLCGA